MQYMSLEHLISLPSVLSVDNVPYIPSPNKVDLCFTNQIAPADVNPTAFILPFMPNGDLVLTDNIRRGPEACGGHIEPGETALEAAIRESMEEAGIARLRWVASAGLFRSSTEAAKPDGYRYPHPVSVQQFFTGEVEELDASLIHKNECHGPVFVSPESAEDILKPLEFALYVEIAKRYRQDILERIPGEKTMRILP